MKANVASALSGMSSRYRKIMTSLFFRGQTHAINQVSYETDDFVVVELQDCIELNGQQEQYLAVTRDHLLYSIDVFADPNKFLTTAHGDAEIRCI